MKLHYMGKFDLNPESLPHENHLAGAVQFKEAKSTSALGIIANVISFVLLIPLLIILYLRYGIDIFSIQSSLACICCLLIFFPHEFLHAICFKKDVYLYTNLLQGMFFVIGTETMSKSRFIFMSMLPNLIFGVIPYILTLIFPALSFLGIFSAAAISMGGGDFYNVFNAITQMPKGARTYLHKFNSFWYMPL